MLTGGPDGRRRIDGRTDGEPGRVHGLDRDPGSRGGRAPSPSGSGWWPWPPSARSTPWPPRPARSGPSWSPSGTPRWPPRWPRRVPPGTEVMAGPEGLAAAGAGGRGGASTASSGFAGLPVTLAALEAGRRLALANKESLIAAAPVVQRARRTPGAEIVPVDSEHCAIHQCLAAAGRRPAGDAAVARLLVDRLGRPVPRAEPDELAAVTRGRRPRPPDLEDGSQDHHRLLHPHEQGPRGDRGPRAVRDRLRPHRGGRPPPVGRPLDGRAGRRGHHRPALDARHAPAHRLRHGLARADRHPLRRHRLVGPLRARPSSRPTGTSSPASTSPTGPGVRAAPPRPG